MLNDLAAQFLCLNCHARFGAHVSWCAACGESGLCVRSFARAMAAVDSLAEETDARSLAASVWGSLSVRAFPELALSPGALLVVHGPAGAGKSTWAARALDSVSGPVLLLSSEEPPGPTLAARLARCSVKRGDFAVVGRASVDQLVEIAARRSVVAIVVDSVQIAMFTPRDLRHLLAVLPSLQLLIAVAQENKSGIIAGKNDLIHEADVVVGIVAGGSWVLEKSRYQDVAVATPIPLANGIRA